MAVFRICWRGFSSARAASVVPPFEVTAVRNSAADFSEELRSWAEPMKVWDAIFLACSGVNPRASAFS